MVKFGVDDKPYMTSELKLLKRKCMKVSRKKRKSDTYTKLKKEFEIKLKKAAEDYLNKNVEMIKESNPGQAYNILKKLGARTGDCEEANAFHLPSYEGLTSLEAADKIAEHFSKISCEFPP